MKPTASAEDAGMSDDIRPPAEPEEHEGQGSEALKNLRDSAEPLLSQPNLESSTKPEHGASDGGEEPPAKPSGTQFQPPPDPGLSALEELLKASEGTPAEAIFGELKLGNNPEWLERSDLTLLAGTGSLVIPTPEEVAAIESGNRIPAHFTGDLPEGWDKDLRHGKLQVLEPVHNIGPQPNGDYGVVVTVPEQLVSLVLGQSETEGVTPGEWLSVRVADYLEQWAFGR